MPRTYDRLIPPVDKDPNRFGTDYANPLEAVSDAAAVAGEQIRDQLVRIIMDKTGIDLSGPIEFINWLSAQINVTLGDLATTLLGLAAPIIDKVQEIIDAILAATGIDLSSPEDFLVWLAGLVGIDLRTLAQNVQEMIDGLFNLFSPSGAVGKTVAEAVAAIQDWLTGVFQPVSDGLAAIVKMVQDLLDGLFGLFGVSGVTGKTPLEVITAIGTWLSGVFQPVSDGLAAIVKTVTDLIDGFFKLFGGSGTVSLTGMLTVAGTWMTHWQEFVDGIWTAFTGGAAGVGKTVADALAAITGWFGGVFQKLIDGINALASLIPGFSTGSNPIQNVVDIISGILGIGQSAASAAATANIKVLALEAAQKNGFHDEFDYAKANVLPAPWTNTGNKLWGPSGKGILEYNGPNAIGPAAEQVYKRTTDPIVGATGTISVGLWKPPIFRSGVGASYVGLNAQVSLTDSSCLQWWIQGNQAELRVLNAVGNATRQGAVQTLPPLAAGDVFEMSWTATESTLKINDIVQATRPWTGTLTGQHIGFTVRTAAYTWLGGGHPAPELSGIAWHP